MNNLNSKPHFNDGQELKSIFWALDHAQITVGEVGCEEITVVMESGQMAEVAWRK